MLRTDTPVTVHRKDYTPPAFAFEHVDLTLELDPARTVVTNILRFTRQAPGPLVLAGEALELVGVRLDGKPLEGAQQTPDSLTLPELPAQGTRWKSSPPASRPPTRRCPASTFPTATSLPSAKPRASARLLTTWTAPT